jgi:hypothetical protein
VKHNPRAYDEVSIQLYKLTGELIELRAAVGQVLFLREHTELGDVFAHPAAVCEQVTAAADALVEAIKKWVPRLVPTPRRLDELLQTVADWQPSEQTRRAADSAQQLFEQLHARAYDNSVNLDGIPNLDQFIDDLSATVQTVGRALS